MSASTSQTGTAAAQYEPAPGLALRHRLFSARAALMLFRNTVVSCSVFAGGLLLFWLLVEQAGMNAYPATAISFVAANSTHYALGRVWIFRGTSRALAQGYALFFVNAGIGLAATMALFALFTELAAFDYLAARIAASLFAGLAIFTSNAVLNFKVL
ncbi:MAG: GtrA family protein [Novosphingobium sp.]|nr:GtrA family protein [Novosphingobium sp.]MCB2078386.1 GtrA family protein [Novosphingobium sp.]